MFLAVLFSALITLLASVSAIAEKGETTSISANTQWINQLGSTLSITSIDSTGLLTGSYVNRAAGSLARIPTTLLLSELMAQQLSLILCGLTVRNLVIQLPLGQGFIITMR